MRAQPSAGDRWERTACLILCRALICLSALRAQELIQVDEADPPFMYASDGRAAGLYSRILTEAFTRMGVDVSIGAVPWRRALSDVDSGSAGVAGIYRNTERLGKYDFSAPFFEERIAVYSLGGGLVYSSLRDLYGKTVGIIDGWFYGYEFEAAVKAGEIRTEVVDGDMNNMLKLAAGRVDAVLAIVESGDLALRKIGRMTAIRCAPVYLGVYGVHLAFGKAVGKKALLSRFDDAIEAMKADGTFESIVAASLR